MQHTRHHILDRKFKLEYPEGTRCTTVTHDAPRGHQPVRDWQVWIQDAIREFLDEHATDIRIERENFDPEDLFVTIGFTTSEVLIEVSDRMIVES